MLGISEILSLELKKTDALDLYKPLSSFITKQYGNHVAKEYEGALQGIQQRRTELRNLQEKSEGSRDLCLKYAADLAFIDKHFPVNSGADRIALTFSWYDLFSRKKVSQGNIFYEQANVLFTAAALESQIAAAENRNSDEGQKNATKAFQNAAGIFNYIKEKVANKIVERITNDMTAESLECLSLLMLANAQQCVVEKADKGKMKPGILAKLAASASGMYGQAAKIMASNSEVLDRTWRDYANFKALYFEAVAHFYLSVEHYAADEMGNTLSRIKKAYALMDEAKKYKISKGLQTSAKSFVDELNKKEQVAEHENQKIYHERVPDVSTLPAIEKRDLAKITSIDDITTYIKATDAFERLYPVRVMEAKQRYTELLNSKLQIAFRTAREHRDKVKAGLAQMGLPGSIMAVEQKVGFPEQVHERIQKINQSGGMSRITDLKTILEEMSTATYESCNKLKKLMEEEQQDDEKCRQMFGARWTRHASSTLTVNLKKQLDDFISKVSIARKSDDLINQKIKQHSNYFTRFTLDRSELDKIMPTPDLSNVNETLGKSYNDLKQALTQLDQCFAQEDSIENEVKQVQTQENIEPALLENQENIEAAIQQELNKYELKFKELAQLGQDEENIMQTVVNANQLFVQHKSSSKSIEKREAVIQEMYAALNKYDEVLANIKEGIQFYTSMQDILKKHQQRIEDFVFARRTEKQDLITNIQTQASGIPAQQPQQFQAPPQYQPQAQQQNYYMPPQYQQLPPTPNQQQQQYPIYQGGYQQQQQQQPPQYQQRPLPPTPHQYQPYPPQ